MLFRSNASGSVADIADFRDIIEWDGKRVKGVTIQVPEYEFQEIHYRKQPSRFQHADKLTLMRFTATVNSDVFREWKAGEVLFLGAYGKTVSKDWWELTYEFAVKLNRDGSDSLRPTLTIGGIANIEAKGWDHVWVKYKSEEQTTGGTKYVVQVPDMVVVSPVYLTNDFNSMFEWNP